MSTESLKIPGGIKFINAGLAGMGSTFVVQPLDLIKNRMQLAGTGGDTKVRANQTFVRAVANVLKNEGIRGLYAGLSAGLLRQASYTTARIGTYTCLFEMFKSGDQAPDFTVKILIGSAAGIVATFVGTPTEVALVRMTADGRLPPALRRNYKNGADALIRVAREEGVTTLWRGTVTALWRNMVASGAQLASYSQTKDILINGGYCNNNIWCDAIASCVSGFVTATVSMPAELIKTRLQDMRTINGVAEYKGPVDVFVRVVREGVFGLWKGFVPYYGRISVRTALTLILLEQMNYMYTRYVLKSSVRGRNL